MTDSDVQAYLKDMRDGGEDIAAAQIDALSNFVRAAKGNGYWSKLIEVYPLCGKTINAARYKLKVYTGLSRLMSWWSSAMDDIYYSERGGLIGDNVRAIRTGLATNGGAFTTTNDGMLAMHVHLNDTVVPGHFAGAADASTGLAASANAGVMIFRIHSYDSAQYSTSDFSGFWVGNRANSATDVKIYKDGTLKVTATANAAGLCAPDLCLGGRNYNNSSLQPNTARIHAMYVGKLFTDTDCVNLSEDHAQLMRELRRA